MYSYKAFCLCLCVLIAPAYSQWGFTLEQTEVYDLVDETRLNFYDFLGVNKVCIMYVM